MLQPSRPIHLINKTFEYFKLKILSLKCLSVRNFEEMNKNKLQEFKQTLWMLKSTTVWLFKFKLKVSGIFLLLTNVLLKKIVD